MAKLVSKTYGDALFAVALEEDKIDVFFSEVQEVLDILRTNEELSKLMSHPKIIKEDKMKIIDETFSGHVSNEIIGLMTLLIAKGHYTDMVPVFEYFIGLVKEEKKIGVVSVTTAIPTNDKQKSEIEKSVLDTTAYETLEMNYDVDESLIGGMVIRIKDRVVDSSIKTKLYELSKELRQIQIR